VSDTNGGAQPFDAALAEAARAVEQEIDRILPRPNGPAAQLADAMRYAVLGGGKRLRAFLVLEAAQLMGGDRAQALRVAAAIECVHAYSLIHDDLPAMDDDDERHGKPTVHRVYDEATAILAGDALQSVAFEIIANPPTATDAVRRADIVLILSRAIGVGGMAGGQMDDLLAEKRAAAGEPALTLEEIRLLQSMKTGALIRASVLCGARLGQATRDGAAAMDFFGDRLGGVFQIRDDLLDIEGDPALAGKRLRKDAAAGKATFVSLLGADGARDLATKMRDEAVDSLKSFGPAADGLRAAANFALTRTR
jgi:farnesyl diphosphate synthase